jgi:hypothetical protein
MNHFLWLAVTICELYALFMANEAGVATRLHAGIMNAGCFMALGAIVHFHAIPGVVFEPADAMAPDVSAITGNPILFVGF